MGELKFRVNLSTGSQASLTMSASKNAAWKQRLTVHDQDGRRLWTWESPCYKEQESASETVALSRPGGSSYVTLTVDMKHFRDGNWADQQQMEYDHTSSDRISIRSKDAYLYPNDTSQDDLCVSFTVTNAAFSNW